MSYRTPFHIVTVASKTARLVGWLALFEVWCKEVASEIVSGKCLLGGYAVRTPCLGISMAAGRHALWM